MVAIRDSSSPLNLTNNKGQSTIEFVSTLSFALVFLFLFFQMALNFTNGYLVQFATYQASRAYVVYDDGFGASGAEGVAQNVFNSYHDLIKDSLKVEASFGIQPPPNSANPVRAMYIGAYSEWEDIFSLSNVIGGKREMKFKSESYLGKEPGRQECIQRLCTVLQSVPGSSFNCGSSHDNMNLITAYDNGC